MGTAIGPVPDNERWVTNENAVGDQITNGVRDGLKRSGVVRTGPALGTGLLRLLVDLPHHRE